MVDQSGTLAEAGEREAAARAVYERWPFYLASSSPPHPGRQGLQVDSKFDWDSAPGYYQESCYELADIVLTAIGRGGANQPDTASKYHLEAL